MRRVSVSCPFSWNPRRSEIIVARIARQLVAEGSLPLAPQIYFPRFLDEVKERGLALKLCLQLVSPSDEVRVYGDPSEGMRLEIAEAERLGIPVVKEEFP